MTTQDARSSEQQPEVGFSLRDPSINPDHLHERLADLRARCPVAHSSHDGAWLVSTYDLVRAAFADPVTFSSRGASGAPTRVAPLDFDPPDHTPLRRLLGTRLALPAVTRVEPSIHAKVDAMLAALTEGETVDVVEAIAEVLPVETILDVAGLTDDAERGEVRQALRATSDRDGSPSVTGMIELIGAINRLIDRRHAEPADDLVSELVSATIDGEAIARDDVVSLLISFLFAGHHSTIAGIGLVLHRLATDADLFAAARSDQGTANGIIDEALRLEPPFQYFPRTLACAWEAAGVVVPEGQRAHLVIAAANRDPREFPEPDRFDPGRPNLHHSVTFGHGIHKCVGLHLARAELRLVVEGITATFSSVALAGPATRVGVASLFPAAFASVPVCFAR